MHRAAVATAVVVAFAAAPQSVHAQIPTAPGVDLSGSYRITTGAGPNGEGQYGGRVEISRKGGCYHVHWEIHDGTTYEGVGLVLGSGLFAVAWTDAPREGYGVVAFLDSDAKGGYIGEWCQPDGGRGDEWLGPPRTLLGAHPIRGEKGSYSGTLTVTRAGESADTSRVPLRLAWRTTQGDYPGYGVDFNGQLLVAVRGMSEGGGLGLYAVGEDQLDGQWASIGFTAVGVENLQREPGKARSTK